MDQLYRNSVDSDSLWKYPEVEDVHVVENEQTVPLQVNGDWKLLGSRNIKYIVQNVKDIVAAFKICTQKC